MSDALQRQSGVWRLGDRAELKLPWGSTWFPVVIRGFEGKDVLVEAARRADDPDADDDWKVPFKWLRRPRGLTDA